MSVHDNYLLRIPQTSTINYNPAMFDQPIVRLTVLWVALIGVPSLLALACKGWIRKGRSGLPDWRKWLIS
jgi:uncharacterized protein involved in cysteine biosynthesis